MSVLKDVPLSGDAARALATPTGGLRALVLIGAQVRYATFMPVGDPRTLDGTLARLAMDLSEDMDMVAKAMGKEREKLNAT